MYKNITKTLIAFLVLFTMFYNDIKSSEIIESPDGKIVIEFKLDENGNPIYSVKRNNKKIIESSKLSIIFENGIVSQNLEITKIEENSVDETYNLIVGKADKIRNHYNEVILTTQEKDHGKLKIQYVLRAYNDGIAFRSIILDVLGKKDFIIADEVNEFNFTTDSKCWPLFLKNFRTSYENEFTETTVNKIDEGVFVGLPLIINLDSRTYIGLAEAALTNYAGMYLEGNANKENSLISKLASLSNSTGISVIGTAPHKTPWRVVMIGERPGDLIESNLITNLNEPCAIEDPSWIKAGKAAWPWWSGRVVKGVDFEGGMNTETMKYYIDFAKEFNLKYLLIDAGWYGNNSDQEEDITSTIPEIDIHEIVSYGSKHGVDILLWINWRNGKAQLDEALPLYEKWGVKGIKIDYMNRDHQVMVNFYERVLKKAAEHHLLVDFHGAFKPTGLRRTYPNYITSEGALSMEYSRWTPPTRLVPEHNVTVPFTRMVVGPMDYTPGAFRNVKAKDYKRTKTEAVTIGSRTSQLAMFVVYDSPLQSVADHPAAYRGQPGAEFIKIVPTTWNEVKVLAGEIGDYIAIARRSNDEWFIGVMTDDDSRSLELSLEFLESGKYSVQIYRDGEDTELDPTQLVIEEMDITSSDILKVNMVGGGGYVAHIVPMVN